MLIRTDDLASEAVIGLLQEHLDHMYEVTPAESVHALDVTALRTPDLTFWTAWDGEELLGCAALKELDAKTGEVKSMRTVAQHRGKGVASRLLEHVVGEARRRSYEVLYLETGSTAAFAPARALYAKHGFTPRGPYGRFTADPNLVFMERRL